MRKLLTIATIVFVTANAYALPASPESVETLLAITKTESLLDSMYANLEQVMRQGMSQSVQGKTLDPEQQRILDAMPGKFMVLARQELSWEKLKPLYVQLYRDTFEQDEVDGLIEFYKSPAGHALVAKMPVLMQKMMVLTQSQFQSLLPKVMAAINSAMAEAKIRK